MTQLVKSKSIMRLATILFCFFFAINTHAQTQNENERIYIKIEIKGLACPYCAFGMEKELKEISGVEKVEIELKTGLAYISTPVRQKPTKEELEKIITDSGFTVGEVSYSDKPF